MKVASAPALADWDRAPPALLPVQIVIDPGVWRASNTRRGHTPGLAELSSGMATAPKRLASPVTHLRW